jgi:2-oxoglutarate decarboxylase
MTKDRELDRETFGPNVWLVDEMYRRYLENPKAVGESWREFFEDYQPSWAEPAERKQKTTGNGVTPAEKKAGEPRAKPAAPPEPEVKAKAAAKKPEVKKEPEAPAKPEA